MNDLAHSLFEAALDFEAQAIETNDIDGAQRRVGAHQDTGPPCGVDDGHKAHQQPHWTP